MTSKKKAPDLGAEMTRKMVIEYLENHPDFLREHPDMLTTLTPPEADHGGGVLDFQQFALGSLQKNMQDLKEKYDGLIVACRDNMSTQAQVHQAVLGLMKAQGLERLMEILTQDLVRLFDVDVVRLGMESETPAHYETFYSEGNYSGITFLKPGTVKAALKGKDIVLCEDVRKKSFTGFEEVFAECEDIVDSCALLKLTLTQNQRHVILAFGVRHGGRFHPGQGTELLSFLAEIVEYRLDAALSEII